MKAESIPAVTGRASTFARKRREWSSTIAFWAFMSPMLIGLVVFTVVPIVWGFLLSFAEARLTISIANWVWFENYRFLLSDPVFRKSMMTGLIFTAFIVPLTFAVSLGLALLVNNVTHGRGFFRTIFFIPTAISYVVAALIWRMSIFNGLPYGLANLAIWEFGVEPIAWIGTPDPPWHWLVLVTVRLWLQVGFYMVIFIAGLQEIPKDLYEAAYVDGARPGWTTFRTITLPLLANTSIAVIVLNIIAGFQAFDEFYNILVEASGMGGNVDLARTPLLYLYGVAMVGQDYGRGSAGAFLLMAVILLVTLLQARFLGFGRQR
jgi:multiple sugar transport system permease protein